jgi:hypothetical protein
VAKARFALLPLQENFNHMGMKAVITLWVKNWIVEYRLGIVKFRAFCHQLLQIGYTIGDLGWLAVDLANAHTNTINLQRATVTDKWVGFCESL